MLRQIKQKHGENIQLYADRVMGLAEVGFEGQENSRFIESQLVDMFANGLNNEQLKMTIFRKNPDSLQGAMGIAIDEANLRQRVTASGGRMYTPPENEGPVPMEIDHSRKFKCYKCHNYGHKANVCKDVSVNAINRQINERQIRCWNCGEEGHIIRNCPNTNVRRPPAGHGRNRYPDRGQIRRPGWDQGN